MTNHKVILRAGKIHEFEMVKNILSERKIPFITQQESISGLRISAPVTSAPGSGRWWTILVPILVVHKAEAILSELPFEVEINPSIWHFGADKKVKKGWRIYAWLMLLLTFAFFVFYFLKLLD